MCVCVCVCVCVCLCVCVCVCVCVCILYFKIRSVNFYECNLDMINSLRRTIWKP